MCEGIVGWGKMLNAVNTGYELDKAQFVKQIGRIGDVVINLINNPYKNFPICENVISNEKLKLYQKKQDINQFSNLAMSCENDLSHEQLVKDLFDNGIWDPFSDETIEKLSRNQRLLDDLSL